MPKLTTGPYYLVRTDGRTEGRTDGLTLNVEKTSFLTRLTIFIKAKDKKLDG